MSHQRSFESVLDAPRGDDVEQQAVALEEASRFIGAVADEAVAALRRGPNRFLLAERLHWLGNAVVAPLRKILAERTDGELMSLASLVLLQLGTKEGVPWLLNVVDDKDNEYSCLAAQHLVTARVKEAIEPMLRRLRSCELNEIDTIVCFVSALEDLGEQMPLDVQEWLSAPSAPQEVQWLLRGIDGKP